MGKMLTYAVTGLGLAIAAPVLAQGMTPDQVGAQPLTGLSASDYVKLAADSDNFEIQSGRVAALKSKRADVKGFAKQMVADHTQSTKTLTAALTNQDRKIAPPSTVLSSANAAKLALLKKAPKATFDQLYLQQQLEAHRTAWALQKGYADTGTDPALKQVAATTLPVVEQHLSAVKGMSGGM